MWDGHKGVNVFFVISGFVIYLSSTDKIGKGAAAARHFLYRRNVRIYTFYWILLFILLILGQVSFALDYSFLKKVLLAPGHVLPQLGITWSLTYELYFYYLFAIAILLPIRQIYFIRLTVVLWLFSAVIMFLLGTAYSMKGTTLNFLLGQNIWQFLTGILAAYVYMNRSRIHPHIFKFALVLGCFMVFFLYFPNRHPLSHPVYGIGAALLVVGIAAVESTHQLKFPKIISSLGDASYIAYLIHVPILALLYHYNIVSKTLFSESILYVIPVVIGIWTCSLILYKWIEKPLLKYLYK